MSYLNGDLNINYVGRDKWVIENTNKHLCACGCKEHVIIILKHHSMGIPKFIHGHNSRTEENRKINSEWHTGRTGSRHPRWIEDRSKLRGPRRWTHNFSKLQKKNIYIRDNGICQNPNCGIVCLLDARVNHPHKVNIDHIVSIQNGGSNKIENGQLLCLSCHRLKHSATANWMNSGKPRTGNPERSPQSGNVQRLPESSDTLNNRN